MATRWREQCEYSDHGYFAQAVKLTSIVGSLVPLHVKHTPGHPYQHLAQQSQVTTQHLIFWQAARMPGTGMSKMERRQKYNGWMSKANSLQVGYLPGSNGTALVMIVVSTLYTNFWRS